MIFGYSGLFLLIYVLLNTYLSIRMYRHTRRYFQPINVTEDDQSTKMINIHDKYFEFSRKDNISFLRLWLGLIFLFWIRIVGLLILAVSLYLILKISFRNGNKRDQEYRNRLKKVASTHAWIALYIFGIKRTELTPNVRDVYLKYLGPDYDITDECAYSCIITNHISWYEIVYLIYQEAPGFIAKQTIADMPFIGYIAERLDSLFLDRTNEKERNNIVNISVLTH
jgi:hypothetical protein